jgi:TfoX/Sxy family transcriptional regulator of competence genes
VAVADSLEELGFALDKAAEGLGGVTKKRMFGCDGLFANGNVFGLIWKEGRIGVRLPNEIAYAEAMKMPGASPWKAGTMTMSHWVLVPEAMHRDPNRLGAWVRRAHALAFSAPKRLPVPGAPLAKPPAKTAARPAPKPAPKKARAAVKVSRKTSARAAAKTGSRTARKGKTTKR